MGFLGSIASHAGYSPLQNEKDHDVESQSSEGDDRNSTSRTNALPRWLQQSGGRVSNPLASIFSLFSLILPFPLRYSSSRSLPKVTSTSYMNGMRGIACVVVFINHILFKFYPWMIHPYDGAGNTHIIQLPFLRIIHTGHSMVCIFLVMSGFVLSYSPLRKMHARQSEELITSLCSSTLRRGARLFGPVWALVAITAVLTWIFPWVEPSDWRNGDPSFFDHVRGLIRSTMPLMNPFAYNVYFPKGVDHCWTLGAEFRCSMVVFLMCIATARLSTVARKVCLVGGSLISMHYDRWDVTCFLAGMFIAETRFAPLADDLRLAGKIPRVVILPVIAIAIWIALVTLSWTEHGSAGVQPYKMLADIAPAWFVGKEMNWGTMGAIILIVLLEHSPSCQKLLNQRVFLYLGEISFSFYLLHLLSYRVLGDYVFHTLVAGWGVDYNVAWVVDFVVSLVALLWASDLFWRGIDEPMVNLSRKVVEWLGVMKPISAQ